MPATTTAKTARTTSVTDLTFDEYRILVGDELGALSELNCFGVRMEIWREAYEKRAGDSRCMCCQGYISPTITGYYDGGTCFACGAAQEEDDDLVTYDKVIADRQRKLRKHLTLGRGGRYSAQAKRMMQDLFWADTHDKHAKFPTKMVDLARRELAGYPL